MNSDEGRSRKLRFFTLGVNWRHGCSGTTPTVDWSETIKGASTEKRSAAGDAGAFVFEPRGARSMIMVKRTPGLDVATVAHDSLKINPIKLADVDDFFALINYAYFYPFNAFAVLGASAEAPGVKVIEALANTLDPGGEGAWKTEPIMSDPDISQFKKARKVKRMTVRTTVFPTNLLSGLKNEDYGSAFESFSDALGSAEVELTMDIKVKRPKNNQGAQDKLKQFTSVFMGDPGLKKLDAYPTDTEFTQDVLRLVEYRLTQQVELPQQLDPAAMCEAVAREAEKRQKEVQDWIKKAERR